MVDIDDEVTVASADNLPGNDGAARAIRDDECVVLIVHAIAEASAVNGPPGIHFARGQEPLGVILGAITEVLPGNDSPPRPINHDPGAVLRLEPAES